MLPVSQQQQKQQQSAIKRPTNKKKKKKGNKKKVNDNRHQRPNWRNQKPITEPANWSPTQSDDSDQEVCMFYMAGRCDKVDGTCPYSHDVKVPKVLSLCKHYVADSCSNIETCRFLHQEFPCKFFHSTGNCRFGSNCKFNHEKNELTNFLLEKHYEDEATRRDNIQQKVPVFEMQTCNSPPLSSHNIETTVLETPEYVAQLEIDPEQISIQNQMDVDEQQQQHAVPLPVFSNFYQDTTEEPQQDDNNNDAPMPLEITSILSSMDNYQEPPSSPQPTNSNQPEAFLFPKQCIVGDGTGQFQGNDMYPAKVITITLPSINETDLVTNDPRRNNKESIMAKSKRLNSSTKNINWRVSKVRSTKRINYHHIKQSSSMREILMDPRLNKHRAY